MARRRVSVEVWHTPDINFENIELTDIGTRLHQSGFEFNQSEKTILLKNSCIANTVLLNGTIEESVTEEDFMGRLRGMSGFIGVNFIDYKYPLYGSMRDCDCEGFGFITTRDGQRFLGKRRIQLTSD